MQEGGSQNIGWDWGHKARHRTRTGAAGATRCQNSAPRRPAAPVTPMFARIRSLAGRIWLTSGRPLRLRDHLSDPLLRAPAWCWSPKRAQYSCRRSFGPNIRPKRLRRPHGLRWVAGDQSVAASSWIARTPWGPATALAPEISLAGTTPVHVGRKRYLLSALASRQVPATCRWHISHRRGTSRGIENLPRGFPRIQRREPAAVCMEYGPFGSFGRKRAFTSLALSTRAINEIAAAGLGFHRAPLSFFRASSGPFSECALTKPR